MDRKSGIPEKSYLRQIGVALGLVFLIFVFGALTDVSEGIWALTRTGEAWQIDELLFALGVMSFIGLLFALRRISELRAEVAKLKTRPPEVRQGVTPVSDHVDCVIKCVGCGKYQAHGDQWFSTDEFVARTKQSDVFGGVCPSCQVPSNT